MIASDVTEPKTNQLFRELGRRYSISDIQAREYFNYYSLICDAPHLIMWERSLLRYASACHKHFRSNGLLSPVDCLEFDIPVDGHSHGACGGDEGGNGSGGGGDNFYEAGEECEEMQDSGMMCVGRDCCETDPGAFPTNPELYGDSNEAFTRSVLHCRRCFVKVQRMVQRWDDDGVMYHIQMTREEMEEYMDSGLPIAAMKFERPRSEWLYDTGKEGYRTGDDAREKSIQLLEKLRQEYGPLACDRDAPPPSKRAKRV